MPKPWYVDVLTFVLVGVWMAWTFATIQEYGPSLALIGGAAVIAAIGVLTIYGQRIRYLNIGNGWIEAGMRTPEDYQRTETERDQYR